jgi:MerR family copper efflux transcriptional regulator
LIHLKPSFKVKGETEKMLTIGNVAERVGVRPSAIRYYEGQKILQPAVRGANGYRFYTDDAVKLLLFVRRAQSLGITLREIKPLLELATQGQRPCNHVKQLARNHLQEIDQKISELQALRNELRTLLRRKAGRPHGNEVCPIIERGMGKVS